MDWLSLIRAPRLGTADALRLLQHCGSAAGCFTSDIPSDLHPETHAYLRAPERPAAEQDLEWMQKTDARRLAVTEPGFPSLLKQIPDPPIVLFVRGDASLLLLNSLDLAPTSVDALVERTGLTPDVVSSMLLMLELQGHVEAAPGGRYSRVNKRS